MPEIRLDGCTAEPLMSYLKALGVLRIVSEQADPCARACWRDGMFSIETKLDKGGLVHFFLGSYRPTPIIAPWAGGSGFFGSDNRTAVDEIAKTSSARLMEFSALIVRVRKHLAAMRIGSKPSPQEKESLLRHYRREMPDEFIGWMDTALVLQTAGQSFPPLLGTGGNDGRLDFTQNYMQRLMAIGFSESGPEPGTESWLRQGLFAEPARDLLAAAVGQFDPGRAGGPNATTGMEGDALVNPWDFVLMLEGSLVLAGAAARRLGVSQFNRASFPFTVRSSPVGYASAADGEQADSRGEIWLPLWEMPASLQEVRLVFTEGRAEAGGRQSHHGVDFARAVASLGVDRGITAFIRYGFLKRSGKAFVAVPLGTFPVRDRPAVDLLREVDAWLDTLTKATTGDDVPARFRRVRRRLEAAIFDYCRQAPGENDANGFQAVLAALGAVERECSVGTFAQTVPRGRSRPRLYPVAGLSARWVTACDNQSPEFRLARSLAFLRGEPDKTGRLRRYMEPVKREKNGWRWAERGGHVVWAGGDLVRNLGSVLIRRLLEAEKAGEDPLPLSGLFPAALADLAYFLDNRTDDRGLEELLWGLALVDLKDAVKPGLPAIGRATLPSAYALLKLTLLPGRLEWAQQGGGMVLRLNRPVARETPRGVAVKAEPAVLTRLAVGDVPGACEIALRRLRASGFAPLASSLADGSRRHVEWSANGIPPTRLLASLLFPISDHSVDELADLVLRRPSMEPLA